jgi:SAM-dependent methyltransferase
MERNFFGVIRVTRSPDGKFIRLIHGTTLHGQQRADEPDRPPRPMTYYHRRGPVGHLFECLDREPGRVRRVGVVGLGTGAVAAYAKPGQEWTFYEIDSAVVRVARDERYFRFLSECQGRCDVVLGDARRQLAKAPDDSFDVIILDGFCSDAIPVHLLTREAIRMYVTKLAPRGVVALHVSNVHLDLPPLVARLADDHDPPLCVRVCNDLFLSESEREDGKSISQWMLLARTEDDLRPLLRRPNGAIQRIDWQEVPRNPDAPLWRDDFANLLRAWKKRED